MPRQPSKKRSKAQKEQFQNIRFTGETLTPSTLDTVPEQLESVSEVDDGPAESPKTTHVELVAVTQTLEHTTDLLNVAEQKNLDLYSKLCVERCKIQRSLSRKTLLEEQVKLLKTDAKSSIAYTNKLLHHSTAENAAPRVPRDQYMVHRVGGGRVPQGLNEIFGSRKY